MANYADIPPAETLDQANWQRDAWIDTAAQNQQNTDYYRGLLVQIAEMLGVDAYTADDGTIYDTPLCIKVPELVKARLAETTPSNPPLQPPPKHQPKHEHQQQQPADPAAQRRAAVVVAAQAAEQQQQDQDDEDWGHGEHLYGMGLHRPTSRKTTSRVVRARPVGFLLGSSGRERLGPQAARLRCHANRYWVPDDSGWVRVAAGLRLARDVRLVVVTALSLAG
jgi:hypothetical protein